MIKIENVVLPSDEQWLAVIRGMRNPLESYSKIDSIRYTYYSYDTEVLSEFNLGENDLGLMKRLVKAGKDHSKFMRMIPVYLDVTAPLYWWKEESTYQVGTVTNSCSTMHTIHKKAFTLDDFSKEHLFEEKDGWIEDDKGERWCSSPLELETIVGILNAYRHHYLKTKDKKYWWAMIQLLPSSYNQRRTIMLNYEVLANMYKSRKNHKLDEWVEFCKWIETLPYSELITGDFDV